MWRQLSSHVVRRAVGRLPCTIPRGIAAVGVGTGREPASVMGHAPCGARFFANNKNNNNNSNTNKNAPKHNNNNNNNNNKRQKTAPARSGGQPPKGNNKGNKGNTPALTFRLVMSEHEEDEEYDVDDDVEDMDDFTIIKVPSAPKTLADLHPHFLKSELLDEEDLAEGVEIQTNSGDWEVLHDVAQLAGIRKRPIPLRNPAMFGMFGESDDDEDYDDEEMGYSSDSDDDDVDADGVWAMRIGGLVERLQTQGYVPKTTPHSWALVPKSPGDNEYSPPIPTRDWILQEAAHDPALQRTLLNKVGALDHIVQCLHMPFVWERQRADDDKEEGEAVEAAFTHKDE
jgi:hypothetical protein